ncbi:hypothetical protein BU15DRAFT_65200 [Melanogaster broomeanus]|nr:hypothetical protein BU15DRAFT_65200 [Melanogaster broomeanus]
MDQPVDGISPAPQASSPPAMIMNATATPPSMPLDGECNAQRHTNGARTSQQHGAIAHGEGPKTLAASRMNIEEPLEALEGRQSAAKSKKAFTVVDKVIKLGYGDGIDYLRGVAVHHG